MSKDYISDISKSRFKTKHIWDDNTSFNLCNLPGRTTILVLLNHKARSLYSKVIFGSRDSKDWYINFKLVVPRLRVLEHIQNAGKQCLVRNKRRTQFR